MSEAQKEKFADAQSLARQEHEAEKAPTETIATYIERQKPAILAALPRNVDVDRFARIVLTTIRTSPRLLECSPMSILAAVMQSAQLGLEPGSGLGECYVIPYKHEATFQLGYRGVTKLAHNSGEVSNVWAEAVYEGDDFRVELGTNPGIHHLPTLDAEGRGTFAAMTAVYAVGRMKDGTMQFAVMTKAEVEQHRDRYSKGKDSSDSPWKDPLGAVEMGKKTVVIRLGKMLPLSAEVTRAFSLDGAVRRDLKPEMTLVPDKDETPLESKALGAEPEPVIEAPADIEPPAPDEEVAEFEEVAPSGSASMIRTLECLGCGREQSMSPDATEFDIANLTCDKCGGRYKVVVP